MHINCSIPHFYCFLRKEFLYDQKEHHGEFIRVAVFGITSIGGRAIGFNVLTEDGAQFSRIPIHALVSSKTAPKISLENLELWDCFGEDVGVVVFDYLWEMRCKVILRDRKWHYGKYMFTIDWCNNPYSEEPTQQKCAHMIMMDNGCYAAQPNNRIIWFDPAFTTKIGKTRPDYKINSSIWCCEHLPTWFIKDDDNYFYDDEYLKKHVSKVKKTQPGTRKKVVLKAGNNGHPHPSLLEKAQKITLN